MLLVEKYRPNSLENIVLNPSIREKISSFIEKKSVPNLILYGKAGTGKTSLVNIIIKELGADYESYNASEQRGIDVIRDEIMPFVDKVSMTNAMKIVDLREAEELTPNAQKALKDIIESNSEDTRFIFTTNNVGKIIPEIISRCEVLHIEPNDNKEVARHLWSNVILAENIEADKKDVMALVNRYFPDIRRMIMSLEASISNNTYTFDHKETSSDIYTPIFELLENFYSTSKNEKNLILTYKNIRPLLLSFSELQLLSFYTELNNWVDDNISANKLVYAKILISSYAFKFNTQIDKEMNTSALILELLNL